MTENEVRQILRVMRDEPVPVASLHRVRLAVAERTRPRVRARWWSAAVLAAMACLLLLLVLRKEKAPVRIPPLPVIAKQVRPLHIPLNGPSPRLVRVPRAVQSSARSVKRVRHAERDSAASEMNAVIRIETPDPDVVILLLEN